MQGLLLRAAKRVSTHLLALVQVLLQAARLGPDPAGAAAGTPAEGARARWATDAGQVGRGAASGCAVGAGSMRRVSKCKVSLPVSAGGEGGSTRKPGGAHASRPT